MAGVRCAKCEKTFAWDLTFPAGWVPLCLPCARVKP
jgi:hypothetical protein